MKLGDADIDVQIAVTAVEVAVNAGSVFLLLKSLSRQRACVFPGHRELFDGN